MGILPSIIETRLGRNDVMHDNSASVQPGLYCLVILNGAKRNEESSCTHGCVSMFGHLHGFFATLRISGCYVNAFEYEILATIQTLTRSFSRKTVLS